MSLSPSFRTFVLEQLSRVLPGIRARSMFGGVGIYSGELFFALIEDDTLYFKVDDSTRGDFQARGMAAFRPGGADGEVMQYYEVPADLLEEADVLRAWAERAVAVAARKRRKPSRD
ncbi:MAG: TfoX/Sxy family protein [Gemmatimonadales bacterium]